MGGAQTLRSDHATKLALQPFRSRAAASNCQDAQVCGDTGSLEGAVLWLPAQHELGRGTCLPCLSPRPPISASSTCNLQHES